MGKAILSVENLSKKFCRNLRRSLWYGVKDLTREMLLRRNGGADLRRDEFWALKDVAFELRQGETLGLIGHNGAGKSTLLKLINGLIRPDTGCIRIRGRVGALIELGAGFNPILTGRENIYVNAAVLGLRRKEVDRRLDEIIDFAEIGDFIDAPLQTYSSGMRVRLGFSIAANLDPDILVIDEILSVGDASFRQRCVDRLTDYGSKGGTIIFVSHNSATIETLSDRVVLLDHGHVMEIGKPFEVIQKYEAKALELSRQADLRLHGNPTRQGADDIRVIFAECRDKAGNHKTEFEFEESFEVLLHYESSKDIRMPYFIMALQKGERQNPFVSMMSMLVDGIHVETIPRRGVVGCMIETPSFSPGVYRLHVAVQSQISSTLGNKWYLPFTEIGSFTLLPGSLRDRLPGAPAAYLVSKMPPMILTHSWSLNGQILSNSKGQLEIAGSRERSL